MSRQAAINHLRALREHLNQNVYGPDPDHIFERFKTHGILFFPRQWADPLEASLKSFLQLGDDDFLVTGSGSSKIEFFHIANSMIERLVLGVPETKIIDDWIDLLSSRKGLTAFVCCVSGVTVSSAIILGPGVQVIPPEQLPATREREAIFRIGRDGQPIFDFSITQQRWRIPSAAILIESSDFNIIRGGNSPSEVSDLMRRQSVVQDRVLVAMALSGVCAPVPSWSYSTAVHPALAYHGLGSSGVGGTLAAPPIQSGAIDPTILAEIYEAISKLGPKEQASLSLSIGRLARSRGHASPADRAIDLGIAIESLLLHGESGPGAKGELRNKVGLRGAWLLGRTPEEREHVFRLLRSAYDARSQAVHSGVISQKNMSILEDADQISSQLFRVVVQMGRYPDWDKLVLGYK
ncbi:hypothetical protein ACD578_08895 [Microvirga sp. RSM25]|uniref:hypothetical protein n=1 Tax=Microvirga sp. RSM25 TaxID=3273802 RepID=UPI00384EF29B